MKNVKKRSTLYLQISVDLSENICDNLRFRIFRKKDKCENEIKFGQHSGDRRSRNVTVCQEGTGTPY